MSAASAAVTPSAAPSRGGLLLGGCTVGLAISWNIANVGPVAGVLARHHEVGLGTVGLLTSILFVAELVVLIPAGRAIDRLGAKRVGIIALLLDLVGNALLLVGAGLPAALVLRAVVGLGVGLGFLAGAVYVQPDPRRPTPLLGGIYGGVALSGGGLALALVPQLVNLLDWRAPYVSGTAVAALALALVARCPATPPYGGERTTSVRALTLDPAIARLGAVHSASFGISVVVGNWVVPLLERTAGFGRDAAGTVGSLTLLLGIAGRWTGGLLAGVRPRQAWTAVAFSFVAGAAAVLALVLAISKPVDVVAAAVIGVSAGMSFGPVMAGAARAHPDSAGAAVGAMNTYPIVAIVAGIPLVGLTFEGGSGGRLGFAAIAGLWFLALAAIPRHLAVAGHEPAGQPPR